MSDDASFSVFFFNMILFNVKSCKSWNMNEGIINLLQNIYKTNKKYLKQFGKTKIERAGIVVNLNERLFIQCLF